MAAGGNGNRVVIEAAGVVKTYTRGGESVSVLDGLDLRVREGEWLALMGPSGSGKTTLLNVLGGLDHPDQGSVIADGEDIEALSPRDLAEWRSRHVGFIFQLYNLIPVLTAYQNVELPLLLQPLGRAERDRQVRTSLGLVGLSDRLRHYPNQLSGGQEQRVAIARALATDPTFLLADEPTGDLDARSAQEILDLLGTLHRDLGKTSVMVTHDPRAAARADRLLHLEKGVLLEQEKGAAGAAHP
ncbi:MAG TPA: ABC transporter ATP-binding protein [Planctomycetota bacterium]|nr:ABC transporter ATP-binding protein [Planctomycetota bacterium]